LLLDIDNVFPYLVEHGFLDRAAIVDGSVRAVSASRRNRNQRITREGGPGLLLKQAEEPGAQETLRSEAAFYSLVQSDERAAAVRSIIPKLVGTRAEDHLLLLELLDPATPIQSFSHLFTTGWFLASLGAAIGNALGTCHRALRSVAKTAKSEWKRHAPWVLWVHRPGPEILMELSAANHRTLEILQRDQKLSAHLDELRRGWQTETLVHCDIKGDNILVVGGGTRPGEPMEVRFVDWELVQLGDPAWDVAAMWKDFLVYWITSMPVAKGMKGAQMAAAAHFPLGGFQLGAQRLFDSYRKAAELDDATAEALLLRSVRYSGAYLVQYAYESAQRATKLGNHEIMMIQVSANILADPTGAAQHLLGLPIGKVAP
jgi:Ser/Thr protein kinase RdoA (MazF antagonist)